jgi:hypothetical protein
MRVVLTDYSGTIVLVVAFLFLFALYLSWTATRLDRLHLRLDAAKVALDAQLVRRASVTLELAQSGVLDPATSLLLATAAREARDAQDEARDAQEEDRETAESSLTRDLRAAFDEPEQIAQVRSTLVGPELLDELATAAKRVQLARQFYNESVRTVRQLRSHRLVRAFRLAGRAPDKPNFDIDDTPPDFSRK